MLSDIESEWIVGTQIPAGHGDASGAFRIHPDAYHGRWQVVPYEGNVAAWGIMHGGERYAPAVRAWLMWYMNHMDLETGYIPTYTVDSGTYKINPIMTNKIRRKTYGCTDACAATFITACRKYADVTGDWTFLRDNRHAVWSAVHAMESTRQTDGFTRNAPGNGHKYLINNCEVYQALQDLSWMCTNVYNDGTCDADRWSQSAVTLGDEITARFWDHSHDMFVNRLNADGTGTSGTWDEWHNAYAQMYPVLVALDLWPDAFDTAWPTWTDATTNPGPAALVAYTAALTGRHTQAQEWLRTARHGPIAAGHHLPWTIREAAYTVATALLENV